MRFEIPGKPFGKMRPRRGKIGVFDPKENAAYEKKVRESFKAEKGYIPEPIESPIWINIVLYYAIPKHLAKKTREAMLAGKILPTIKPDADNCAKSILDALNGFYYKDDKQVVLMRVQKLYGETAKAIVDIGRYTQ